MLRIISKLVILYALMIGNALSQKLTERDCREFASDVDMIQFRIESSNPIFIDVLKDNLYFHCMAASSRGVRYKKYDNSQSSFCIRKNQYASSPTSWDYKNEIIHFDKTYRIWFSQSADFEVSSAKRFYTSAEQMGIGYVIHKLTSKTRLILLPKSLEKLSRDAMLIEQQGFTRSAADFSCFNTQDVLSRNNYHKKYI